MAKHFKISELSLIVFIIAMATAPAILLGEGNRNLLLIGVMAFSPILWVIMKSKKIYRSDIILLLFMLSIVIIPFVYNPQSMRWATVLYTLMFAFTFIVYNHLLHSKSLTIQNYLNILKYLIYAYCIVLLIQQFCVLTGLPIVNLSNYVPSEPWKLNSLSSEPAHSARIVALLMYSYIVVSETISNKIYIFKDNFVSDKWIWFAFLWLMLTMGSGTAFLFILFVLSKLVKLKQLFVLALIVLIIIVLINFAHIDAFERTYKVFIATLTLNPQAIVEADHSASIRIVPFLLLSKMASITSMDGWFGHGIDYVSTFMYQIVPGVKEGFSAGGMFQFWIEYGFLSFALFVTFSFFATYNKDDFRSVIFWFFLIFMYGINSQIVWLTIILLHTNIYFKKNKGSL